MPAKPKNKRKKKIELPPVRQLKIDEQVDYDSEWDETEDFEVERIIDVRFCRDNTREFLIRWKGYSANRYEILRVSYNFFNSYNQPKLLFSIAIHGNQKPI